MNNKYCMSLSLNVLNHLGINLYSNIPAVLSEIVANSWDADAKNVFISINDDEIIISDDGIGMDTNDINDKFLYVGYRKRENETISPKYQRKYMGRKGIGKLSMFSIAKEVDVISKKEISENSYTINAFRMNIDDITKVIETENHGDKNAASSYHPEEISYSECQIDKTGTIIILRKLKKNTSTLTAEYIKKRVARRFGIIGEAYNFSVFVNGEAVSIADRDYFHKLRYIWYFGDESKKYAQLSNNVSFAEKRDNIVNCNGIDYKISGWIGSVEASGDLKDGEENLNKIVILVRGKLGQEDILSEYSEGGLYSKYIIGEINADFFDEDNLEDMATSNRQEYRHDDDRFVSLKDFIYNELKYIQSKWTELRNESGEEKALELLPKISTWIASLKGDDKTYAKKMFGKINQIVADNNKKKEILKYGILAFEKLRYTNHLSAIDNINVENFEIIKEVFGDLDEIEATLYYQIIKERIEVIKKFQEITDDDMREKVIQEYLFDHLWLLDPAWERVENTEYMERSVLNALEVEFAKLSADERNGRLDIGYRETAGKHIIIELKKANRVVKLGELVQQISKYHDAVAKTLSEAGDENAAFEIICVLGKPVDNDNSSTHKQLVSDTLKASKARIVFYQQLIQNAYKAYSEYIEANKQSQPLIDLFNDLELDDEN